MSDDRRDGRPPATRREPPSTNEPRLVAPRVPARHRCEQLRDGDQVPLSVEPVEASPSPRRDATHRRRPTSAR